SAVNVYSLNGYAGGLVGVTDGGSINYSYSTGNVDTGMGGMQVGGLVGSSNTSFSITNSYSTGNVNGDGFIGGLVGRMDASSTVSNSYSMGNVSGNDFVGGLVGRNLGTVTDSYWNTETSGQATSAGGTGLTTAQMMNQSNFTGW